MTRRAGRFIDCEDPQTSPVSSQAAVPWPKSSSGPQTGSWLVASNSPKYQMVETPIDATKERIISLSLEVKDLLLSFSTYEDIREIWAKLSKDFVLLARKHLLEDIEFEYKQGKASDIDGIRPQSLWGLLGKDSNYVRYVRYLSITDNHVNPDKKEGGSQVVAIDTAKRNRSPGSVIHDKALAAILGTLTNLSEISLRFNGYTLDCQQYDQEYSGALSQVLNLPSLTSISLRGISRLSLSRLKNLPRLTRLSLSDFGLEEPDALDTSPAETGPPLATQSTIRPVRPLVINVSDIHRGIKFFHRFITGPASNIDFSNLTLVNTDLYNFDDITLLGYLLVACAGALEFLRVNTKTLKHLQNSIPLAPDASLSPIILSNLTSLKTLKIRLNFRSPIASFDEIDWFLQNIRSLPDRNCLEDIEFIMDIEHADRKDLSAYTGWEAMDATFVGRNIENLKRFKIIICSADKKYYYGYSLTEEIRLPRLEEKGPYSTGEDFDLKRKPVPHLGSFIEL